MPARNSIFNDCPNESAFNAEHFGHGHVPQPSKDNDEDRDQNERGYDSNDDADKLTLHKYRPETVWKKREALFDGILLNLFSDSTLTRSYLNQSPIFEQLLGTPRRGVNAARPSVGWSSRRASIQP
jgi:hypothetical protein